ncbi:MAG: hypothetical protein PF630_07150 [Gammaproteobacteria bacterium]|jgi:hypothetical protein|nr:hypothetical protein [Gammaproteobacteria bacterium]
MQIKFWPVETGRCVVSSCWAMVLMLGFAPALHAGQVAPGVYLDQISNNIALEIKAGYQLSNNKILYAGLYNNGSDNVIELKTLDATSTGVSVDQDHGNVDSGQIFGLGDWCFTNDYAIMPYIKDFNVYALRYNRTSNIFDTIEVIPSQADQYTSTDCMTFNTGANLVFAANNFDAKGIDYYRSDDDGNNWSLSIAYRLNGDNIIDAFAGGFRDTHAAVNDSSIGSIYQRSNGDVETALLNFPTGNLLGTRMIANGSPFIGNGQLKELDGVAVDNVCLGGANLGATLTGAFVTTDTGETGLGSIFNNAPGANPVFNFSGMDISVRNWGGTPGLYDIYYLSNTLITTQFDINTREFSNSMTFPDFPFNGNGGPAEAFAGPGTDRYHAFGVSLNFGTGGLSGTGVATIDPATAVSVPVQPLIGLPSVAVPALNRLATLLLLLTLASIGAVMLVRRSG